MVDLKDPNRPRFTMQELKEVLQERNQLKAQLLIAQEELQLYKRFLEYSPPPTQAHHIKKKKKLSITHVKIQVYNMLVTQY